MKKAALASITELFLVLSMCHAHFTTTACMELSVG